MYQTGSKNSQLNMVHWRIFGRGIFTAVHSWNLCPQIGFTHKTLIQEVFKNIQTIFSLKKKMSVHLKAWKVMIQIEREEGTISDYGGNELIDGDRPNESLHLIRCIKGTILRLGSKNVIWPNSQLTKSVWTWDSSGKFITAFKEKVQHDRASEQCVDLGFDLVKPESSIENDEINYYLLRKDFYLSYWLRTQQAGNENFITENQFKYYNNFRDDLILFSSKIDYAISLNQFGWQPAESQQQHGIVCESRLARFWNRYPHSNHLIGLKTIESILNPF